MKIEEALPIGSIVKIEGIGRKLMVFGYMQKNESVSERVYDYTGVVYPEGHIDSRLHIGFNHTDITDIYFNGYEDKEREEFVKVIQLFEKRK